MYYKSQSSKRELGSYRLTSDVRVTSPRPDDLVLEGQKYALCIRGLEEKPGVKRIHPLVIYGRAYDEVHLFKTAIEEACRAGLQKKTRRPSSEEKTTQVKESIKVFFGASGYLLRQLSRDSSVCADALMLADKSPPAQTRVIYDIMARDRSRLASVKPSPRPYVMGAVLLRALGQIGPIFPDEVLLEWLRHFRTFTQSRSKATVLSQARQVAELLRLLPMKSNVLLEALFSFLRRASKASSLMSPEEAVNTVRLRILPPLPESRPAWITSKLWRNGLRRFLVLIVTHYEEIFESLPKVPVVDTSNKASTTTKPPPPSMSRDEGDDDGDDIMRHAVRRGGEDEIVRDELEYEVESKREPKSSARAADVDAKKSGEKSSAATQVVDIDGEEKLDLVHDEDAEEKLDTDEEDLERAVEERRASFDASHLSSEATDEDDDVKHVTFDDRKKPLSKTARKNESEREDENDAGGGDESSVLTDLDEGEVLFSESTDTSSGEETLRMMEKNVPVDLRMPRGNRGRRKKAQRATADEGGDGDGSSSGEEHERKLALVRKQMNAQLKAKEMRDRVLREAEEARRKQREAEEEIRRKRREAEDEARRKQREAEKVRKRREMRARESSRRAAESAASARKAREMRERGQRVRREEIEGRRMDALDASRDPRESERAGKRSSMSRRNTHDLSTLPLSRELMGSSSSSRVPPSSTSARSAPLSTPGERELFDMIRVEKARDQRISEARARRDRAVAEKAKAAALRKIMETPSLSRDNRDDDDVRDDRFEIRERHAARDRARAEAVSKLWKKVRACTGPSRSTEASAKSRRMLRVLKDEIDALKSTTKAGSSLHLMLGLLEENVSLSLQVSEYQEDILERTRRKHEQFLDLYKKPSGGTPVGDIERIESAQTAASTPKRELVNGGAVGASPFATLAKKIWGAKDGVAGEEEDDEDDGAW